MIAQELSARYAVRRLTEEDIEDILVLCAGNPLFYRYHPPRATCDSIRADMAALPPKTREEDKFYLGYFARGKFAAVLDLILGYPKERAAYIGFFMLAAEEQGKGEGSKIVAELASALKTQGIEELHLAIDRGNPQSEAFWKKNGFKARSEDSGEGRFLPMEKKI